jgi:hypothetical protein
MKYEFKLADLLHFMEKLELFGDEYSSSEITSNPVFKILMK